MKSLAYPVVVGLCAVLALAADQNRTPTFQDKARNMALYAVKDFSIRNVPPDLLEFRMSGDSAKGLPVEGDWKSQGLQIVAMSLTGSAKRVSANSYSLLKADAGGGVKASLQPPSSGWSTVFRSESVNVTVDKAAKLIAPGAVDVTAESSGTADLKGQAVPVTADLALHGSSLTATMEADEQGISGKSSSVLAGPVKLSLKRTFHGAGNPIQSIVATGDRLTTTFDQNGGTITLSGHVVIDGDSDAFSGEAHADSVSVKVDGALNPIEVDLSGSPARSTYSDHPARRGGG